MIPSILVLGVVMGLLAIACALLRPPAIDDPNDLAPHDRLDPIEDDDPDLPYGWSGP